MSEEQKPPIQNVPPHWQEDEISLKELILKLQEWYRYLRSKWRIILLSGVVGALLGLAYAWTKKPKYEAKLTFALEEKSSSGLLSSYAGLASQLGFDVGGISSGVFSEDNIMDLMQSRLMITQALLDSIPRNGKIISLADDYIRMNKLREAWKKNKDIPPHLSFPAGANPDSLSHVQDSLMGKFCEAIVKNYLDIEKTNKNGSIIAVTCTAPDELFAKTFTESLVKHVSLFYIQTKTKRAASNVAILQDRLDSVRQAYHAALYGTAVSTDQNLNPARAVVNVPTISKQTQAQILGAEYAELVKNLEIAKMTLLQETPLIQVIDKPILPLKEKKLGKLKGLVLGGIIGGLICCFFFFLRKTYYEIMINE